jgi:hypothetical protein
MYRFGFGDPRTVTRSMEPGPSKMKVATLDELHYLHSHYEKITGKTKTNIRRTIRVMLPG